MRDADIRHVLKASIRSKYGRKVGFAEEIKLESGFAIADCAVFFEKWQCFEIKSKYDSLRRLEHQIFIYSKYFYKTTVITSQSHIKKIVDTTPNWIGITEITDDGVLKKCRKPLPSPSYDPLKILGCLWKEELVELFDEIKMEPLNQRHTKKNMIEILRMKRNSRKIHKAASKILKARKSSF